MSDSRYVSGLFCSVIDGKCKFKYPNCIECSIGKEYYNRLPICYRCLYSHVVDVNMAEKDGSYFSKRDEQTGKLFWNRKYICMENRNVMFDKQYYAVRKSCKEYVAR